MNLQNNQYLYLILILTIVMYCSLMVHKLPKCLTDLLNNFFIKSCLVFGLLYLMKVDYTLSLILTLAFLLTNQMGILNNLYDKIDNVLYSKQLEIKEKMTMDENKIVNEMDNVKPSDNLKQLSNIVSDKMGLDNDNDSRDYISNYGLECKGKFDDDGMNPNNQYLYENVYKDNLVK